MLEHTHKPTAPDSDRTTETLAFRPPTAADGVDICDLIASCPPLDRNSLYCNLLQCTDFADTCILATSGKEAVGWISAYRPPNRPGTLFVWQVAVRPQARGLGLARRMILALLKRPACRGVTRVEATITPDNEASWALFESVADTLDVPIRRTMWFEAETAFQDRHDSEYLVSIGPIPTRRPAADRARTSAGIPAP